MNPPLGLKGFFNSLCVCMEPEYVYHMRVGVYRGQKRGSDALRLELESTVNARD